MMFNDVITFFCCHKTFINIMFMMLKNLFFQIFETAIFSKNRLPPQKFFQKFPKKYARVDFRPFLADFPGPPDFDLKVRKSQF